MTSSSAPDSGGIPPRLHAGKRLRLAIVGGGPLCVYALERLAAQLGAIERPQAGTGLRIDVFERSGRFGAGEVNHDLQPATSLLNRVAAQIGFSADETNTSVAALLPAGARPTFLEWAVRRSRERGDPAYALAPAAIPSRRMHGEALTETFTAYVARLREAGVELHCHARSVVDLVPEADHSFTIVCADAEHGDCAAIIRADRVLLATGNAASFAQSPPPPPDARGLRRIARVYPLDRQLTEATVPRGAQVAISGLGLTAADVLLYLTEGRGGRFEKEDEAGLRLRYVACGREPARIVAFSPSGMLPCCRPENFKLLDPELAYRGVFFNVEALQRMRGARGAPMRRVPATSSAAVPSAAAASASPSMRSATASSASPADVSLQPVVRRSTRRAPIAASSAPMRRDTVAWLRPSRVAAPSICPARATARKTRMSSQSIEPTPLRDLLLPI